MILVARKSQVSESIDIARMAPAANCTTKHAVRPRGGADGAERMRPKPIDDEALLEMRGYRRPGNVRELQNAIERMLIMSSDRVTIADLPEELTAADDDTLARTQPSALRSFRDNAERDFIIAALKRNHGNIMRSGPAVESTSTH